MLTDICSNDAQNSSVLSLNGVELSNNFLTIKYI